MTREEFEETSEQSETSLLIGGLSKDNDDIRGRRLRWLRKRAGFTQVELGQAVGQKSASSAISQMEHNTKAITLETAGRIAAKLEVPICLIADAKEHLEDHIDMLIGIWRAIEENDLETLKMITRIVHSKT
jgi:transcriptional regulator with XRE-family HTH domain